LIDPDTDVGHAVAFDILGDGIAGLGTDPVIFDPPVPQEDFGRDAEGPTGGIEQQVGFAFLDHRLRRGADHLLGRHLIGVPTLSKAVVLAIGHQFVVGAAHECHADSRERKEPRWNEHR